MGIEDQSGKKHRAKGVEHRTAEPQNIEPQNIEGWNRYALSFKSIKIDRSTLRLSTGRIPSFDIRHLIFII